MAPNPLRHYRRHESEYNRIADALKRVREQFEQADRELQRAMLFDSSVFAVISVQNDISILRRAFRGYAQCDNLDDLSEIMQSVNYGNNKYEYIKHNKDVVESEVGDEICQSLEDGNTWDAMTDIVKHMSGVSWIKAAFVPAMLGFTDTMCIDTNVAQMVPDDSVQASGYNHMSEYSDAVIMVENEFPYLSEELSRFMLQWVVFDANRSDGVAHHEEWFEYMLPGTPFGRQMVLGSY